MAATAEADKAVEDKKGATLPPPQMKERGEDDIRRPKGSKRDAVKAAGHDEKLTEREAQDATDWFLSEDPEDWGAETDVIEVNVGSRQKPKWVRWEIKAVDEDVLRSIQRQARQNRRPGSDDLGDDIVQNSKVIVKGTVYPDLEAIARDKAIADPAMIVRQRFTRKVGLIAQIAGEIMAISGFDADDVREANAAGN